MRSQSIQIIQSFEEEDSETSKKLNFIHLIEQYENGLRLRDVLCGENKNLPIFVISISGKTRSGKSFFLNLMIKYLQSKGCRDWTDGEVPRVFEWKGGVKSITRGLWICSKVFRFRNKHGMEVGILLLDNQGLYDGEQTDGVATAISGISTALSFYQIFNVKDSLCDNDLESIWKHLISDKHHISEDASATKLMFVVRDFVDQDIGCGLGSGQVYIESEKNRGTQEHKDKWNEIGKMFPNISCLTLPLPGIAVMKGAAKEMKDIDPEFLDEVGNFFDTVLNPTNLNVTKNIPTGQKIFDTLKNFDGRKVDDSLSFINVFTELGNQNKLDILIRNFDSRIDSFKHNPTSGQALLNETLTEAKKQFKGKSACEFIEKLKVLMIQKINDSVKEWILRKYEASVQSSSSVVYTHSLEWAYVKSRLFYLVGSEVEKNKLTDNIITSCAEVYYGNLRKHLQDQFQPCCENKTLEGLQGYDEQFVSREFKENIDFQQSAVKDVCRAIWMSAKESLRFYVQSLLLEYVGALTEGKVDKDWLQNATKTQFKFFEIFTWNGCHWVEVEKNDDSLLEIVGFTMFKKAQELCDYPENERKEINKITEQIKSVNGEGNTVTMTCIFILYKNEGNEQCEPVFKVKSSSGSKFIDINSRVYNDWKVFQEDNKLPDCLYCHPVDGECNKENGFQIGFTLSPASTLKYKMLRVLDVVGKGVALGSAVALGTVAAAPVAPAVIGGALTAAASSGIYGLGRCISKIKDKVEHEEGVSAGDVVEVVANSLSVATGTTAGAVVLTTLGRELSCAPAIIQGISSLTNLALQINAENISYMSVANDTLMFLLFNSKTIGGVVNNIQTSYRLPPGTSTVDILKHFIDKNSVTFPTNDGENLRTEKFLSDNLKSLLVTAIINKPEKRPLQFLRDIASSENLGNLMNAFSSGSDEEEQLKFFGDLISLVGKIIEKKRNENSPVVSYRALGYNSSSLVTEEVALASICTGLSCIAENRPTGNGNIQQVCLVTKEILKFICENSGKTALKDIANYLENHGDVIVKSVLGNF